MSKFTKIKMKLPRRKIYKLMGINNIRMFPGDPTGLPDVFFLINPLKFGNRF